MKNMNLCDILNKLMSLLKLTNVPKFNKNNEIFMKEYYDAHITINSFIIPYLV